MKSCLQYVFLSVVNINGFIRQYLCVVSYVNNGKEELPNNNFIKILKLFITLYIIDTLFIILYIIIFLMHYYCALL